MSDDIDIDSEETTASDLRNLIKKQAKELKEQREALSGYTKAAQKDELTKLLTAKGVDLKYARLFDRDVVTEDTVAEFLKANDDIIPQGNEQQDEQSQNERNAADVNGFSGSTESGTSVERGGKVLGDPEEIMRFLKTSTWEEAVAAGYMPANPNTI